MQLYMPFAAPFDLCKLASYSKDERALTIKNERKHRPLPRKKKEQLSEVSLADSKIQELLVRSLDQIALCTTYDDVANKAILGILETAAAAIRSLHGLAGLRPEVMRRIARGQYQWPVIAMLNSQWKDAAESFLEGIEFGEENPFGNFPEKAFDQNSTPRGYARQLVECILGTRGRQKDVKLEPLQKIRDKSPTELPEWALEVKLCGLAEFNKENVDEYQRIAKMIMDSLDPPIEAYAQACHPQWYDGHVRRAREHYGDRKIDGRVRAQIRDAILNAFPTLLPRSQE